MSGSTCRSACCARSWRAAAAPALVQADGLRLPFADATFDAVMLMQVFGGMSDWRQFVDEVRRVLRPDGAVVIGRTAAPEDGVDARMKGQLDPSCLAGRRGAKRQNARARSRTGSARVRRVERRVVATWTAQRTPRQFIARHRNGARFSVLPDTIKDDAIARLATWAETAFGSLDAASSEVHTFELRFSSLKEDRVTPNMTGNDMLTELGKRLVSGSLSDAALQRATEATPNVAILPWANVVKIGGQSIMDRGRAAVGPVVDEIVANLPRHKMILGTGAGTRARHVYSLAIDLGLPVGVLTVLGTAVAWQNAQMLHYLMAKHGIAFLEPEGFASLPHYLMERGAVICQGMPPYKLWEGNPRGRAHSAAAHRHRLLPDRRGVRRAQDDLRQGRGRPVHRRSEEGQERHAHPAHQRAGAARARPRRPGGRTRGARTDAARAQHLARSSSSTG